MDAHAQEAIFYITAGLCTFLAIIWSYRWLVGQPKKEEEKEAVKKKEKQEDKVEDKVENKVEDKVEDKVKVEEKVEDEKEEDEMLAGCPFSFLIMSQGENNPKDEASKIQDSLGDLLIDSSDIQPLDKDTLTEDDDMMDHRRVKQLEEEVVKSMTEQQRDEEANARQAQLEAIYNLMEDNKERFGMSSVDDVQTQYKLYV